MKDFSESVLARLLNYSRQNKMDYQSILIRYSAERFLYRLGLSEYKNSFLLKGAYLLSLTLENQAFRPTKDIDFLKTGDTDTENILEALKNICSIHYAEDGLMFDIKSIKMQEIREQNSYKGQRAKVIAFIGKARVVLQIDIGIGDSVYPDNIVRKLPSLLDLNVPEIASYPIETVISEKLEAIISLGFLTSRMKDFYDIYIIINSEEIDYLNLKTSIKKTFSRRQTDIPTVTPDILTEKIFKNKEKIKQWNAFVSKLRNENTNIEFSDVIISIQYFTKVFWVQNNNLKKWHPKIGWE